MNSTSRRPSQLEQLARRTRKAVIIISHTMRTIHEIYPFNLFHRIEKKGGKKRSHPPQKFPSRGNRTLGGGSEFSRIYWRSTRGLVFANGDGRNE